MDSKAIGNSGASVQTMARLAFLALRNPLAYKWGSDQGWAWNSLPTLEALSLPFDVVLCADTLYDDSAQESFVHALLTCCDSVVDNVTTKRETSLQPRTEKGKETGAKRGQGRKECLLGTSFARDIWRGRRKEKRRRSFSNHDETHRDKENEEDGMQKTGTIVLLTFKKRVSERGVRAFRALESYFDIHVAEESFLPSEFWGCDLYLAVLVRKGSSYIM